MLSLNIPKQISIEVSENWLLIKGPLGSKKKKKSKNLQLIFDKESSKLWLLNTTLNNKHFYLKILNNMILGVWKGFCVKLNIIGVGYKVFLEKDHLLFKLGFSNNIIYPIPADIKIKITTQKQITILIFGNDFQKLNQIAAEIRALKPADPYKGKGIKYFNEIVKKKEGKKTNV